MVMVVLFCMLAVVLVFVIALAVEVVMVLAFSRSRGECGGGRDDCGMSARVFRATGELALHVRDSRMVTGDEGR